MKRNIHNAYADIADYNCFGCSPTNSIGLRLSFWEDGDSDKFFKPQSDESSYSN